MPKPSLESPRAKLDQAAKHIKALYDAVVKYTNPRLRAFQTRHEVDAKNSDDVWRLIVKKQPPISLSVIAGDVAHNLRSCLDHLVWQLALKQTSTPYERAQFPICDTRKEFQKNGSKQIQDLEPDAQALIESVQPYNGSDTGTHLAVLQEISNTDKHKIPIGVIPRQAAVFYPAAFLKYADPSQLVGIRQPGEIIFRVRRTSDRPSIDSYLDRFRFNFDLGVDTPSARNHTSGIIATFNGIHMAINEKLLHKCERFFR